MTTSKNWPLQIDGRNIESKLRELRRPFVDDEIYWRAQTITGSKGNGRAMILAYVDSRCIQERLDNVLGPHNWQTEIRVNGTKNLAGIGIRVAGEWVWKWDGAGDTKIEAEKGGISDSIKRSAVLWGMARHLYELDTTWCDIHSNKPNDVPKHRLVYINDYKKGIKGWCVAPSIREIQSHLLSVSDLVRHIDKPKPRRLMRFKIVASRNDIEPTGPQIQALVEAATAKFKDGKFTGKGATHPTKASDKQIEIGSHRAVKWHEDGTIHQMIKQYFNEVGNSEVPF